MEQIVCWSNHISRKHSLMITFVSRTQTVKVFCEHCCPASKAHSKLKLLLTSTVSEPIALCSSSAFIIYEPPSSLWNLCGLRLGLRTSFRLSEWEQPCEETSVLAWGLGFNVKEWMQFADKCINTCVCSLHLPSRVVLQGLPEAHGKGRCSLAPLWWTPQDPSPAGEASITDSWGGGEGEKEREEGGHRVYYRYDIQLWEWLTWCNECWHDLFEMFPTILVMKFDESDISNWFFTLLIQWLIFFYDLIAPYLKLTNVHQDFPKQHLQPAVQNPKALYLLS